MNHELQTHTLDAGDDPERLLEREWVITNGQGGFAMGTALGCPARRYHAYLIAAAQPPVQRTVALNHVFEQLVLEPPDSTGPAQRLELNTCQFLGADGDRIFAPGGHQSLERFERGLGVSWHYQWGSIHCTRTLLLQGQTQAATLRYQVTGFQTADTTAWLKLAPMLSLRDFHALLPHDAGPPFETRVEPDRRDTVVIERGDVAATLACGGATFEEAPDWWFGLYYPRETERGQDDREDLFVPGHFAAPLQPGETISLTVQLGTEAAEPITDQDDRVARLKPLAEQISRQAGPAIDRATPRHGRPNDHEPVASPLVDALAIAADDFVVHRPLKGEQLSTIIAGYPWFADWGRDTFIALPGLLLTTGRFDEARAVLRVFAEAIDGGLVPNRFDDYTEAAAHYNTVDASLWFVRAALQYVEATGDTESWTQWLAPACVEVIDAYAAGTGGDDPSHEPLIAMSPDGLIRAGHDRTQLTWMDAACGDVVFTPRPGKAVEINALWYNALAGLAETLPTGEAAAAERCQKLASRVEQHFADVFWSDAAGYLFDHVIADGAGEPEPDPSLRPNQLLACALPRSPLDQEKQRQVLHMARNHLLTPAGLRTLPQDDPNYHGAYRGDQFQRDEAYHQGTIWPWLLGPYCEAVLRVDQFSDASRSHVEEAMAPLLASLVDGEAARSLRPGPIGQIAEIYEADVDDTGRFRPVGCIAQAWSVAELLRVAQLLNTQRGGTSEPA